MLRLMNMTDCRWDEERFRDGEDVADFLQKQGLDGLELMHLPGGEPSFFLPGSVKGLHLRNWYDWVDLWKGNQEGLLREYRPTLVLVEHDRDFLDAVAGRQLALERAEDA